MTLHPDTGGVDPLRTGAGDGAAGLREIRRAGLPLRVASGSLSCPRCDAPVLLTDAPAAPADPLACPFCAHAGALRDFLSLTAPLRAPRVEVLVRTGPHRR